MKKVVCVGVVVFVLSMLNCDSYQNILISNGIVNFKIITDNYNPHKPPKEKGELVFWNKMEDLPEREPSSLGPDGRFYGGYFVEGKFGNGYLVYLARSNYASFPPEVIPPKRGCIEFWAKIDGFSGVIPWGGAPIFFHTSIDKQEFVLHFNGNDGEGNGGICARAGDKIHAGTGFWYNDYTYEDILGEGKVSDWHHYALVWDEDGIKDIGIVDVTDVNDRIEKKLTRCAIYIDGELKSHRYKDEKGEFKSLDDVKELKIFDREVDVGSATVIIDNIKIWNYPKTDFSDRFKE